MAIKSVIGLISCGIIHKGRRDIFGASVTVFKNTVQMREKKGAEAGEGGV